MQPVVNFQPTYQQEVSKCTRLASMFIDHFIMTFIAVACFVPPILLGMFFSFNNNEAETDPFGNWIFLGLIGFAVYFYKDSFNGRSPAKRILKLQVLDYKTGEVASPLKCFVRNLSCIIWPVEVIVTLASPQRRLGDFIVGTKVVVYNPASEQPRPDFKKIALAFIIACTMLFTICLPFIFIKKQLSEQFIKSSYNQTESQNAEDYLNKELGEYLTASAKVYDKVENKNIRYVYLSLKLKANYIKDDYSYEQFKERVLPAINETFPQKEFDGYVKFIYNEGLNYREISSNLY